MIRTVDTKIITENVKEMCIEANHYLSKDMDIAMKNAVTTEKSELGRKILNQLQESILFPVLAVRHFSLLNRL